jgi:hypothetical protein
MKDHVSDPYKATGKVSGFLFIVVHVTTASTAGLYSFRH